MTTALLPGVCMVILGGLYFFTMMIYFPTFIFAHLNHRSYIHVRYSSIDGTKTPAICHRLEATPGVKMTRWSKLDTGTK